MDLRGYRYPSVLTLGATLATFVLIFSAPSTSAGEEPFGPTEFDATFSDRTAVDYRLSRECLADQPSCLGDPDASSLCRLEDDIAGLRCHAGIHRFCSGKGYAAGFGVENGADSGVVDITCLSATAAEVVALPHAALGEYHHACTDGLPSKPCTVAIDRYCRSRAGFELGIGPMERSESLVWLVCVRDSASHAFTVDPGPVESFDADCDFASKTVSNACRRAMDGYCRSQDGGLSGGFGPREGGHPMALGCVERQSAWSADNTLPESPALPVDVVGRPIDRQSGLYEPELEHTALAAFRSINFDGRLGLTKVVDGEGQKLQFRVQTPEIFTAPLSQSQEPGHERSFETGPWRGYYGFEVLHTAFHGSEGGTFEGGSAAFCDPHRGVASFDRANRQQSVPGRQSNPFACDASGGDRGQLDHDCYELTLIGVYDTGTQDELWGTPVRIVVTNGKRAGINAQDSLASRARVVDVQVLEAPRKASFPAGEPRQIASPNITGDGRLLVVRGDGMIRYAVMPEAGEPCDVSEWSDFRHLYEMHDDPLMADYGIAKYPIRDHLNRVLAPAVPGDHEVRAAYPWIDRDGDNMAFMMAVSPLYYVDEEGEVRSKVPVLAHPISGTDPDVSCGEGCTQPLHPSTRSELRAAIDRLPRLGLTFVGLWTQGKMFTPDNRLNALDFGVPVGPHHHRQVGLYADVPEGTEIGTAVRTSVNSLENQHFYRPELLPDTPREVVWQVSSQEQTDEVAFDDVLDPRALIVASMNTVIEATGEEQGWFRSGFVQTGPEDGQGYRFPALLANTAAAVSEEVVAHARMDLSANLQWNVPSRGYLLGGARSEPLAAGGFRGKGLWLDGEDDRVELLIPPQPVATSAEMAEGPWFFNVSIEPRAFDGPRRLLTLPDGTWLDLVDAGTLRFGRSGAVEGPFEIALPPPLALAERRWTTIGIVSAPMADGFEVRIHIDGYRLATLAPTEDYFRVQAGRLTLGTSYGISGGGREGPGFRGWVDDLEVIGREPSPEVVCNHARGTLVGIEAGDALEARALAHPASAHATISALLPPERTYARYACERPIADPIDSHDRADHAHYSCLGQTRRPQSLADADKCLREALLFPEGPIFVDRPRPSSLANGFCASCHVNSHPSVTLNASDALAPGLVAMPDDIRRQPMQIPPKIFGNVPAGLFGIEPLTSFGTPAEGTLLDPFLVPASVPAPEPDPVPSHEARVPESPGK